MDDGVTFTIGTPGGLASMRTAGGGFSGLQFECEKTYGVPAGVAGFPRGGLGEPGAGLIGLGAYLLLLSAWRRASGERRDGIVENVVVDIAQPSLEVSLLQLLRIRDAGRQNASVVHTTFPQRQ